MYDIISCCIFSVVIDIILLLSLPSFLSPSLSFFLSPSFSLSLSLSLPLPVPLPLFLPLPLPLSLLPSLPPSFPTSLFPYLSLPTTLVDPQFVIQPENTSALLGYDAAFTCTIQPVQTDSNSLITITWMFQQEVIPDSGSGSVLGSDFSEYDCATDITNGVIEELPQTGTSILKVSNISEQNRGQYFCVALYSDDLNITSDSAYLDIIGKHTVYMMLQEM